jgi:peptidoglycan LD-endopeptidase CwlK
MHQWSNSSKSRLARVHPAIVRVLNETLPLQDCTVIYGARTPEEQKKLFDQGLSRTLHSKHFINPHDGYAHAVDIAPYPIDWENSKRFYYLAGLIMAKADCLHVKLRWGGNWDMDEDFDDQSFMDLAHFELRND